MTDARPGLGDSWRLWPSGWRRGSKSWGNWRRGRRRRRRSAARAWFSLRRRSSGCWPRGFREEIVAGVCHAMASRMAAMAGREMAAAGRVYGRRGAGARDARGDGEGVGAAGVRGQRAADDRSLGHGAAGSEVGTAAKGAEDMSGVVSISDRLLAVVQELGVRGVMFCWYTVRCGRWATLVPVRTRMR